QGRVAWWSGVPAASTSVLPGAITSPGYPRVGDVETCRPRSSGQIGGRVGGRVGGGCGERETEGEGRPLAEPGRHGEVAAHDPGQLPGDVEAEAGAARRHHHGVLDAVELLEDPFQLVLGEPAPAVGDDDPPVP